MSARPRQISEGVLPPVTAQTPPGDESAPPWPPGGASTDAEGVPHCPPLNNTGYDIAHDDRTEVSDRFRRTAEAMGVSLARPVCPVHHGWCRRRCLLFRREEVSS